MRKLWSWWKNSPITAFGVGVGLFALILAIAAPDAVNGLLRANPYHSLLRQQGSGAARTSSFLLVGNQGRVQASCSGTPAMTLLVQTPESLQSVGAIACTGHLQSLVFEATGMSSLVIATEAQWTVIVQTH